MKTINKITSKLSIKIILMHFGVVFLFSLFIYLAVRGFNILEQIDFRSDNTARVLVSLFPIVYGALITVLVSYILNVTIVSRIRKLKDATAKVAKGNFDDAIVVRGTDELSQLTDSFNKMTYELKANEYLSKDFVRNISHEYKTPLSVIKAYSELISSEVAKEKINRALVDEYVEIITQETDRMSTLSKNILQLSLLDSTTIIKRDDTFAPAEQIRNILRASHVRWANKDIELVLTADEKVITSNEQLLYQVWQNLIHNALKFSAEGGKILIDLKISDRELVFAITDYGAQINKDEVQNIFKHFYVGDRSRNSEGSGLGLAIVKTIVDKLGGEVSLISHDDNAKTFKVSLKLDPLN